MTKRGIVVRVDGIDTRLIEKQLQRIIDTDDFEIEEVSGPLYESVDDCIIRLREKECNKISVIHPEDLKLDIFEANIQNEYRHLFESIEVIPEGWIRLNEGAPIPQTPQVPQQQQQQQPRQPQQPQKQGPQFYVFQYNPIFGSQVTTPPQGLKSIVPETQVVNFVSAEHFRSHSFNTDAAQLYFKHFQAGSQITALQKAITIGFQSVEAQSLDQNQIAAMTQGNQSISQALVEIGKDLKEKKVKVNEKNVGEYLMKKEYSGKLALIEDLVISAQASLKYNPKATGDPNKLIKEFMDTFGITADLQNFAKEMNESGFGLVNSAVNFAGKQLEKYKNKNKKKQGPGKIDLMVSHPKFKIVWDSILDNKNYSIYIPNKEIESYIENKVKNQSKNNEGDAVKTEQSKEINNNQNEGRDLASMSESLVSQFLRLREAEQIEEEDPRIINKIIAAEIIKNLKQDPKRSYIIINKKNHFLFGISNGQTLTPGKKIFPQSLLPNNHIPVKGTDLLIYFESDPQKTFYSKWMRFAGIKEGSSKLSLIEVNGEIEDQIKPPLKAEIGQIMTDVTSGATGGTNNFKM
jgi:hypothetical protein